MKMNTGTHLAPSCQDKSQNLDHGKQKQLPLFSKKQLPQVKPVKKQPSPITLNTYIPFGKYQGKCIKDVLHDDGWIKWWALTAKRAIDKQVLEIINRYKLLAQ